MMDQITLIRQRMFHQRLMQPGFTRPAEVVGWLGAVQSQDYEGAKWALGLRAPGLTAQSVDTAFDAGEILRTHLIRPTWHFVLPEDLGWMLALTAPRLNRKMATYDRRLELDEDVYARSNDAIRAALAGGKFCTRQELAEKLRQTGIEPGSVQRLAHLMMRAEQDAVICSGPKRGKQFTYALLDERAHGAWRILEGEEVLAELVRRYFQSHAPATLQDFCWWSGLTLAEARAGVALLRPQLEQVQLDGKTYYFPHSVDLSGWRSPVVHLLPNYDEAVGSYKDHAFSTDPRYRQAWENIYGPGYRQYSHTLLVDGLLVGMWQRAPRKNGLEIGIRPFGALADAETQGVLDAAARYAAFLGHTVDVVFDP